MSIPNTHRCPAPGCPIKVSSAVLACQSHWFQLSSEVRRAVHATAKLPLLNPKRRAALSAAMKEWRGSDV